MNTNEFNTPPRATMTSQGLDIPPTPYLDCLGYGTGVNVWSFNGSQSPWAVKNVRSSMQRTKKQQYQKLINKEAKVLSTLSHENIIGFRGLLKSIDGRNCLAMESGGRSLGELVEERECTDKTPLASVAILKVVNGVSKALHYLHTEKNLLHGDIKSYNILIKGDFHDVKLCDLGVCVPLHNGIANNYTGTMIYNAPEVVDGCGPITGKAETFSLGLVIWEMIALSPPHCGDVATGDEYVDSNEDSVIILNDSAIDSNTVGTRPPLPPSLSPEYEQVVHIFINCTEIDLKKRFSPLQVIQYIQEMFG